MRRHRLLAVLVLWPCLAQAGVSPEAVLKEQDLRVADSSVLKEAASSESASLRAAAYLAMGRIQSEAYLKPLLNGLSDADPAARSLAAFSLGQLGLAEPALSSTTVLIGEAAIDKYIGGVSGSLKRRSVEALGKLGGAPTSPRLLTALKDRDPGVRGEAALALFRERFLKRVPEYSTAAVNGLTALFKDPDPEVRWRAVYAFSRFPEPRAARALAKAAADKNLWVRFFACRALGLLGEGAPGKVLAEAQDDDEALVRTEAVRALGLARQAGRITGSIVDDPSAHVRAANVDALAAMGGLGAEIVRNLGLVDEFLKDRSVMVRGQAIAALPKLDPDRAPDLLGHARRDASWWLRSKAYQALGTIPGSESVLKEGLKDRDARVAAAALESLSKSSSTEIDGVLDSLLRDVKASLELAGTAAEVAKERKSVALLAGLRAAYGGGLAKSFPEFSDDLSDAYDATLAAHPETKARPLPERGQNKKTVSPHLGKQPSPATVVLDTERGKIEIALAVAEAPIHAAAFIESVRKGLYDGLIWHRVVSGFVVQGGDPRGSGWGDAGFSLRDEINELPFERGAVGMPKSGKDTGGCQLFITYVPMPHLDGRYTVFGKVVSGMEAVDQLEPGDVIRRARLK